MKYINASNGISSFPGALPRFARLSESFNSSCVSGLVKWLNNHLHSDVIATQNHFLPIP